MLDFWVIKFFCVGRQINDIKDVGFFFVKYVIVIWNLNFFLELKEKKNLVINLIIGFEIWKQILY